ncbi:MAG: tRNA lysidine(34) synthetase TilS [Bacteroidota bacterium]
MLARVQEFIAANGLMRPGDRIGVAVSGGVDSVCLLHVLKSLSLLHLELVVCHLDHGLRPESKEEAEFVRRLAARWQLPFCEARLPVRAYAGSHHLSLEMAARELRYAELNRMADERHLDRVALGHQRDDQVETILLRIMRGTGLEGLAGIRASRDGGRFVRPLLEISRGEILAYAEANGLTWVEDTSNHAMDIPRNRVRRGLLPALKADYNPGIEQALLSLGSIARETVAYLEGQLEAAWSGLSVEVSSGGVLFSARGVNEMPAPLARMALRRLLAYAGGDPGRLSRQATARLWRFTRGEGGSRLCVPGGLILARRGELFYLGRLSKAPALKEQDLPIPGTARIKPGLVLGAQWWTGNLPRWSDVDKNEVFLDGEVPAWPLRVRSRRPGDRFYPLGLGGAKKIKEVMIEAGVPRESRDAVPLVVDARERVVWLAGLRLDDRFRVTGKTKRVLHLSLHEESRPLC